jgi:hypothetical protein
MVPLLRVGGTFPAGHAPFRHAAYYRFEESKGPHTVPRHEGVATADAKLIRYLDLKAPDGAPSAPGWVHPHRSLKSSDKTLDFAPRSGVQFAGSPSQAPIAGRKLQLSHRTATAAADPRARQATASISSHSENSSLYSEQTPA